jgi:hypothetical protein
VVSTDPKAPAVILIATTESVAKSQLDAAIRLWFQYGDPASIHTLAAAANGCYHALGRGHKGFPTGVERWMLSLSDKVRVDAKRAQNFFKHGPERNDPKELRFRPEHAELLILDSIISHEELCPPRTPLMTCFVARLSFEEPPLLEHMNARRRKDGEPELVIHEFTEPDRRKYLQEVLPDMTARSG